MWSLTLFLVLYLKSALKISQNCLSGILDRLDNFSVVSKHSTMVWTPGDSLWIHGDELWIPGDELLNTRGWTLNTWGWTLDTGRWTVGTWRWTLGTRDGLWVLEDKLRVSGYGLWAIGDKIYTPGDGF